MAGNGHRIDPEALADVSTLSGLASHPNGHCVYLVGPSFANADGEKLNALWASDGQRTWPVTETVEASISKPTIVGQEVVFLLKPSKKTKGKQGLYSIPLHGGPTEPTLLLESVVSYAVSPQETSIAYVTRPPSTAKCDVQILHENVRPHSLSVFDLSTKVSTPLPTPDSPFERIQTLSWDPLGTSLILQSLTSFEEEARFLTSLIWRVDLPTKTIHRLGLLPAATKSAPVVQKDAIYAAHLCNYQIDSPTMLTDGRALFSYSTDTIENPKRLFGLEDTVEDAGVKICGSGVAVEVEKDLGSRIEWVSASGVIRTLHENTDRFLHDWSVQQDAEGRIKLFAIVSSSLTKSMPNLWVGSSNDAHDLIRLDRKLSHHNEAFEQGLPDMQTEPFHWTNPKDDTKLGGIVIFPPERTRQKLPVVVVGHGGPYNRVDMEFSPVTYYLLWYIASTGYLVIAPNFRGSSGRGSAFVKATACSMGNLDWSDTESMLDEAIKRNLADPTRAMIAGGSNGGYLSAVAVTRSNRFKAAYMASGLYDWPSLGTQSLLAPWQESLGGATLSQPNTRSWNPIWHTDQIKVPLLIVHGGADTNIAAGQAIGMWRAMRTSKENLHQTQCFIYPGQGHGFVSCSACAGFACDKLLIATDP